MNKKQLTIILERGDDELWGRIEQPDAFLYTTVGSSVDEVTHNMRELMQDFLEHEGKELDDWKDVSVQDINFTYEYDLTALFDVFDAIKISSVARMAGINESLMRQYATGKKHPSEIQSKKIEAAIRQLGERLMQVTVA